VIFLVTVLTFLFYFGGMFALLTLGWGVAGILVPAVVPLSWIMLLLAENRGEQRGEELTGLLGRIQTWDRAAAQKGEALKAGRKEAVERAAAELRALGTGVHPVSEFRARVRLHSDADALRRAGEKDPTGFGTAAAYLGGHPALTTPLAGTLVLLGDELWWVGTYLKETHVLRLHPKYVESYEFKDGDQTRNAPKGYFVPFPLPIAIGYGRDKASQYDNLLLIEYRDDGSVLKLSFANVDDGVEAANKVGAAKHRGSHETSPESVREPVTGRRLDDLQRLGELRSSGVLTEDEFQAEKARILKGSSD
jgi:hypothetical protein